MKKYAFIFFIAVILILISPDSIAQSFESYDVSFDIAYNNVVVKESMVFETPVSGNMVFNLPKNRKGLSVSVDGQSAVPDVADNGLYLDLSSAERIEISYVTKDLLERNDFVASFSAPHNISRLSFELTLPERAVLLKPLSGAGLAGSSVYPKPSEAGTDGLSIILKWEFDNVLEGDEKSFFVRFKNQTSYTYISVLIILIILLIGGFAAFILLKKPKIKEVEKIVEKVVEKPVEKILEKGGYEKYLKEDEEQVVNILKQREGKCEQGTLRVITGFSKAKLSGLLKELEDRKIIHKEKRGKKNLVFLRGQ